MSGVPAHVEDNISTDQRLWLLANIIAMHGFQGGGDQEQQYLRALSHQLSQCSQEIIHRLPQTDGSLSQSTDPEEGDTTLESPLPAYISTHLMSLVNKEDVSTLLAKLDT